MASVDFVMADLRGVDGLSLHHHLAVQKTEFFRENFFGAKIVSQEVTPVDLIHHVKPDVPLGGGLFGGGVEMNLVGHQNIPAISHRDIIFRVINSPLITVGSVRSDLQRRLDGFGGFGCLTRQLAAGEGRYRQNTNQPHP